MKKKTKPRAATWLALAMGIAAATSVEAAVVYKSNPGFTISTGSAPLFFEGTTAYLLFSAASGDTGGEPSVWAVTNSWASDIRRVNVNDEIVLRGCVDRLCTFREHVDGSMMKVDNPCTDVKSESAATTR